jgi:hypothetical protein
MVVLSEVEHWQCSAQFPNHRRHQTLNQQSQEPFAGARLVAERPLQVVVYRG